MVDWVKREIVNTFARSLNQTWDKKKNFAQPKVKRRTDWWHHSLQNSISGRLLRFTGILHVFHRNSYNQTLVSWRRAKRFVRPEGQSDHQAKIRDREKHWSTVLGLFSSLPVSMVCCRTLKHAWLLLRSSFFCTSWAEAPQGNNTAVRAFSIWQTSPPSPADAIAATKHFQEGY